MHFLILITLIFFFFFFLIPYLLVVNCSVGFVNSFTVAAPVQFLTVQGGSVAINLVSPVTGPVPHESIRWYFQVLLDDQCFDVTNATMIGEDFSGVNQLTFSPDGLSLTVNNVFLSSAPDVVQFFRVITVDRTIYVSQAVIFVQGNFVLCAYSVLLLHWEI